MKDVRSDEFSEQLADRLYKRVSTQTGQLVLESIREDMEESRPRTKRDPRIPDPPRKE